MSRETLPAELVWSDGGHLEDVALSVVADGEDALLPPAALAHLGDCEHCARRLGAAAQLTMDVAEALAPIPVASPAPSTASARAKAPVAARPRMPLGAMAGAMFVVILGALPVLRDAPAFLTNLRSMVVEAAQVVIDMLVRFFASGRIERTVAFASIVSTLVLVMLGVLVARTRARQAPAGPAGRL